MSEENRITKPDSSLTKEIPLSETPPLPTPPAPPQMALPPTTDSKEGWNNVSKIFLKDPAKFAVVVIFVLYFIGFTIWHFYLQSFGVTSMPFLQTEYISAALCFLIVFVCLSVPAFLVIKTLGQNLWSRGIRNYHQWDANLGVLVLAWSYMTDRLIGIFLPNSKESPFGNSLVIGVGLLMLLHLGFGLCLFFLAGGARELMDGNNAIFTDAQTRFRNSRFLKLSNPLPYVPLYLAAFLLVRIFCNPDISKFFLFLTLFFWFTYTRWSGFNSNIFWTKYGFTGRIVMLIGIFLFVVIYIQYFATNQFDKIPKSVGGGRLEKACFSVSQPHVHSLESMGVPEYETPGLSSSVVVGPVGILFRTDSEILFVNIQDKMTTNSPIVRQIRSDLVDGITFLKDK